MVQPPSSLQRQAENARITAGLRALRSLSLAVLANCVLGCGGEPKQESVSGSVTLDAKPLASGAVQFTPEEGQGLAVGTLIQDGAYRLPNPPGLAPGRYRVSISAQGGSAVRAGMAPDMDLGRPGVRDPIPVRYNQETTLRAEVTRGGSNTFPFDLTSKPDSAVARRR
ncbi:MAG: carboxypeptidase-like regulatory domain-containing protein [Isosphaeraceae bacterium]|nr:carboxypeptidase-like regulatory domain-containing protein [Isosphaeraceae bacterium]